MASKNNTPEKLAARARQLVAKKNQGVNWGVVSTISSRLKGCPFGNVVSFSDGAPGSGIPYFYLSARDGSLTDVAKDSRKLAKAKSDEAKSAKDALKVHLNKKDWPVDHDFRFYKLDIEKVFLIDWVGQATEVHVAKYLKNVKA